MKIYVALGTYDLPGGPETIGDPLVIEDDDGSRWMLTHRPGDRYPFPRGHEGDLREIQGLADVPANQLGIDLVGVAEIARRSSSSTDSVERWRSSEADFPQPLADLAAGPVWSWQAVDRWLNVARLRGRPTTRTDGRRQWALEIREGDSVLLHGQPRTVQGVRTLGQMAPYFRFEDGGVFYSYLRDELAPLGRRG